MPGGQSCRRRHGHDDVDLTSHQLVRELREPLDLAFRVPAFEDDPLPFPVSARAQPLGEGEALGRIRGAVPERQVADAIDLPRRHPPRGIRRGQAGHEGEDGEQAEHARAGDG